MSPRLPAPGPRRDFLICLLLALAAAAFRLPRLGLPNEEIFDEVYHAKTAQQYLDGVSPTEWVHPPTAKLLIAVPLYFVGYQAWAWRLMPALAGILLAPVFYLLARRVLANERAALLASVLLLSDGVYLVQSRVAMTNIFAVLFQVASALFVVRAILEERLSWRGMLGAGVALGLALSTRWTSLWCWGFLLLTLGVVRGRRFWRWPQAEPGQEPGQLREGWVAARELVLTLIAFVIIPFAMYVLSYVPWMRQGHALSELWPHTKAVWSYHAGLVAQHPYFSNWYSWPFLYRPTWYFFRQADKTVWGIVAIGNPALWWASLPVALWAYHSGLWNRNARLLFAGAGYFCLYLPWGLSPRTLNYNHYLFEAIPYACLALGLLLDREWDSRWSAFARAYVVLVVGLFVFFLPVLLGLGVPSGWFFGELGFKPWSWFRSWI